MSKEEFPEITPLFRTPAQMRILAKIILDKRACSISELARFANVHRNNAANEIERLERHGWVTTKKQGKNILVYNNLKYPYLDSLTLFLMKAMGPVLIIPAAFKNIEGMDELYIIGSWAARYRGEKGPLPGDIDVVLVGDVHFPANVRRAANVVEDKLNLGLEVQTFIASHKNWNDPENSFFANVRQSPMIDLTEDVKILQAL